MPSLACLNGEILPVEEARVPVWDRGFTFGDSIYEVFRLFSGHLWLESEHVARLRRSLDEMEFPPVDLDLLLDRVRRTVELSEVREGTAYIQITRGVAPRAHAFPDASTPPTEVIIIRPYDDNPTAELRETGVAVISHPDLRWGRCDIKSTNLLGNVLALEHAKRAGAFEAILIGRDGLVTEATHSSVLWVRNGRLEGTPDGPEILPGTKRHFVQSLAPKADLPFAETRITLDDLLRCDEVMLLGTTIEVLPVTSIDGHPVGDGTPGRFTRKVQAAYWESVERWLSDGRG
jgi:D-alanine transaminase